MSEWLPPSSLIQVQVDPKTRNKAIARRDIPAGSTILSVPAFATALLDAEKAHRCDHCLRAQPSLKKCSGCGSYWYCDAKCQNAHWQASHKRLCKKIDPFMNSVTFQGLEDHEKMDSLLLTHLLAHLSTATTTTLPEPYAPEHSKELAILLSLLPGPADLDLPPTCPIKPTPPPRDLAKNLFSRFGNNNFTIHSHLSSIAHGVFPLASRLLNHSCVPNAAAKYILTPGNPVNMEVVSLRDVKAGEEICIPYIDPALMQTRQQVFQITYGFTCECQSCVFLKTIGPIPDPTSDGAQLARIGLQLREFMGVEEYLKTGTFLGRDLDTLPPELYCVLNESYMGGLSETFSKSSHEGDYAQAAESGITLMALYLLAYPKNYPQIGMHLLEMAKTQWNHSFVALTPQSDTEKDDARNIVSQLLTLSRSVLQVLGKEGDVESGPFVEISILEDLLSRDSRGSDLAIFLTLISARQPSKPREQGALLLRRNIPPRAKPPGASFLATCPPTLAPGTRDMATRWPE